MKKHLSHELIFALYLWGFTLLKPLIQVSGNLSTVILFSYVLILLVLSFYFEPIQRFKIAVYTLIGSFLFVLFLDLLFRPNSYSITIIYNFIIYGLLPIHFFSKVSNSKRFFEINVWISLISLILYGWDPLFDYNLFGDYMSYGFGVILPTYFGLHIGRKILKHRFLLPFEVVSLFLLFLFANRSTLLGAILMWVLVEILITKYDWRKLLKNSMIVLFVGTLLFNITKIIDYLILLMSRYGLYSYSLANYSQLLHGNVVGFSSGRDILSIKAEEFIKEKDNLFIGSGAGIYQAEHGFYTHNMISDIRIEYGFMGIIVICFLLMKSILKVFFYKNQYNKLLGVFLLVQWFPKLLLSVVWLSDIGFWCFIAYGWMQLNDEV